MADADRALERIGALAKRNFDLAHIGRDDVQRP
jgi:hypothetical protein